MERNSVKASRTPNAVLLDLLASRCRIRANFIRATRVATQTEPGFRTVS